MTMVMPTPLNWEHVPLYARLTSEFVRLPVGEAKDNFAKAVRASFALDTTGRAQPNPASASGIADEFGFNIGAQKRYGMSFGKDAAWELLLEPINAPVNTYVYKQLTRLNYVPRFGREPTLHNGKQMILTVAEWLHFVPYEFSCPLPQVIDAHLQQPG